MPAWSSFQILGQQFFWDFMIQNDTDQITEDILSLRKKYTKKNIICEFGLLVENLKNLPCPYGQNFSFKVKHFPVILWFKIIQSGLQKIFYQCKIVLQRKFADLLRISWVWIFGLKWKNLPCRYVQIFRFGVKYFLVILWFQFIQNGLKLFYQCKIGLQPIFL